MNPDLTFTLRCKPFKAYPVADHRLSVDEDGTIWVWDDSIAHQWTSLHSLCPAAQRRARKIAAAWRAGDNTRRRSRREGV